MIQTALNRTGAIAGLVLLGLAPAAFAQNGSEDPASACPEHWEDIGTPAMLKDMDGTDFAVVCHLGYIVIHNHKTKLPDWVIQKITREQVSGHNKLPKVSFKQENKAPEDRRATDDDYTNSGFARGHQAPSEDFNIDRDLMVDTFFFSNAVPQFGAGFNSGVWSSLERIVREIAKGRGEIYVITGPIYQKSRGRSRVIGEDDNVCGNRIELPQLAEKSVCEARNEDRSKKCKGGVAVPSALYKIIYDPSLGRANAYIFPNVNHTPLKKREKTVNYLKRFRVAVRLIEEYAEYDFFAEFSRRDQSVIEENCATTFVR